MLNEELHKLRFSKWTDSRLEIFVLNSAGIENCETLRYVIDEFIESHDFCFFFVSFALFA